MRSVALYTDSAEHATPFERAEQIVFEQMRRCHPPSTHFAGTNENRIDRRVDPAKRTAEIAYYNGGVIYRSYVSVITLEATPTGTRYTTRSQAQMWQFAHQAIPLWLSGDRVVCPETFVLAVGARTPVFVPMYIPIRVR